MKMVSGIGSSRPASCDAWGPGAYAIARALKSMNIITGGPCLNGLGSVEEINAFYDSWLWQNRKLVVLGGGTVLAIGLLAGLAAILK